MPATYSNSDILDPKEHVEGLTREMDDIQRVIKEKPEHVVKSKADKGNADSPLDYGLRFVSITHSPRCSSTDPRQTREASDSVSAPEGTAPNPANTSSKPSSPQPPRTPSNPQSTPSSSSGTLTPRTPNSRCDTSTQQDTTLTYPPTSVVPSSPPPAPVQCLRRQLCCG